MELHLVHYKTAYGTIANAVSKPDGLAVLGVMFEISQTDNPAFTPLVNALKEISEPSERLMLQNIKTFQIFSF